MPRMHLEEVQQSVWVVLHLRLSVPRHHLAPVPLHSPLFLPIHAQLSSMLMCCFCVGHVNWVFGQEKASMG